MISSTNWGGIATPCVPAPTLVARHQGRTDKRGDLSKVTTPGALPGHVGPVLGCGIGSVDLLISYEGPPAENMPRRSRPSSMARSSTLQSRCRGRVPVDAPTPRRARAARCRRPSAAWAHRVPLGTRGRPFRPSPEPKEGKARLHLDLFVDHAHLLVDEMLAAGIQQATSSASSDLTDPSASRAQPRAAHIVPFRAQQLS